MSHLPLPCKAFNLKLLSFHADNNTYSVNYMEPGIKSIMERKVSTFQILKFPGGPEAIASYNTPKSPVVALISRPFSSGSGFSSSSSASSPSTSRNSKPWIYTADNFDSVLDTYRVSLLEPDKTEQIQRSMTTYEILNSPGGTFAIDNYKKNLSSTSSSSDVVDTVLPIPIAKKNLDLHRNRGTYTSSDSFITKKVTILRALHFNPHLDSYTVTFYKHGETKQTEQIMKTAEILDLPGGPKAIENYKQLYTVTELRGRVLSVFDFNSVLDNYKVNIKESDEQKKIQKTMTACDILKLPGGAKAIATYKKLQIFGVFNFNAALDNYTVNILQPGGTERIHKLMTTSEIRTLPGGPKAIQDYKRLHRHPNLSSSNKNLPPNLAPSNKDLPPNLAPSNKNLQPNLTPSNKNLAPTLMPSIDIHQLLSTVFEQPLKNLYIVQLNKDQDNYTVSFTETGKRKKTEKMLTRLELLTMQGELPLSFPLCYS